MKGAFVVAAGLVLAMAGTASAQATQTTPTKAPVKAQTAPTPRAAFVDANGDGICDNFQNGTPQGKAYGRGRGNGTHVGPRDGTGYGAAQGARGAGAGTGMQRGRGRP
ncbi:MAG: hypothetical protein ACYC3L_01895 [Gemmatimonadaceae bacterium]